MHMFTNEVRLPANDHRQIPSILTAHLELSLAVDEVAGVLLELDDAGVRRALVHVGKELLHGVLFALCLTFDLHVE